MRVEISYVVDRDWRAGISGVSTFIRAVHDAWARDYDCDFIPYGGGKAEGGTRDCERVKKRKAEKGRDKADSNLTNVCLSKFADSRFQLSGFSFVPSALLFLGYLSELWRDVKFAWSIRSRCKGRIVVTNQFGCETLPIALRIAMPFHKIIAIGHTHPGQDNRARHLVRWLTERLCYMSVSDIVFNSESNKQEWQKKLKVKRVKGSVIHLGLPEPDLTVPDDYPEKQEGCVDFVCVARFAKWKGQKEVLRAWQKALSRTECLHPVLAPNQVAPSRTSFGVRDASTSGEQRTHSKSIMRLILVGDGEAYEECKQLAKELQLTEGNEGNKDHHGVVFFLGNKKDGARYFNGADVAVQLSTEPEAFGLVLLEAMSRGKPVIANDVGGMREIVAHKDNGFLIDVLDGKSVSDAFCSLVLDKSLISQMGGRSKERWQLYFSNNAMISKYNKFFCGMEA